MMQNSLMVKPDVPDLETLTLDDPESLELAELDANAPDPEAVVLPEFKGLGLVGPDEEAIDAEPLALDDPWLDDASVVP